MIICGTLRKNFLHTLPPSPRLFKEYQNASRDEQKQQLQRLLDAGLSSALVKAPQFAELREAVVEAAAHASLLPKQQATLSGVRGGAVEPAEDAAAPLSVEELERHMLAEAAKTQQQHMMAKQYLQQMLQQHNMPGPQFMPPNFRQQQVLFFLFE